MRSTLFHIPAEMFGVSVLDVLFWGILLFGFGWLLWTIVRGKWNSDSPGFLVILAIGAILTKVFLPNVVSGGGFPIRGYGVMLLLAITTSFGLLSRRARKKWNIPSDLLLSLVLWCVIFGLVGARVFHVVEYWPTYMRDSLGETLKAMLMYSEGGLVVYGSIFGGILGGAIFIIRNKLPILATFDLLAPALFLGIAIGRIGCLLNGCCYGGVCLPEHGVVFPPFSPAHDHQIREGMVYLGGIKLDFMTEPPLQKHGFGCSCITSAKPELSQNGELMMRPAHISDVMPGSDAEKAGLKPGMTIQRAVSIDENGNRKEYNGPDGYITDAMFLEYWLYPGTQFHPDEPITVIATDPGSEIEKTISFVPGKPEVLPVVPTQIYSSIGAFAMCLLLLFLDRFCTRDGMMTLLFFAMYPTARFCIEMVRVDEASFMGTGLSVSQNVSIVTLIAAGFLAWYVFSRPAQHAYAGRFPISSEQKDQDKK